VFCFPRCHLEVCTFRGTADVLENKMTEPIAISAVSGSKLRL
jgi:hypothetical protein